MKLYHITERSNVPSILRFGLEPRLDKNLRSKELGSGTVINLVSRKYLDDIIWEEPWTDPVVLEITVPRSKLKKLSHIKEDIGWYVSLDRIPVGSIEYVGNPSKVLGYDAWREFQGFATIPDPVTEKEKRWRGRK